ncbi:heat shock protein HspQ [Neomegalonema perideroedes]|uniref:heat shock protein HspQ n=1 Tax=Neomegalonema perideroedes TaxID=217219 RepID=UPI0003812113|nr:heat shock protein HspQ [Neomegalonema perideroedes]
MIRAKAKYGLGQILRHRIHGFRGVVFDVDAVFSESEAWWEAIPEEARPSKGQPFYHLLAENATSYYVAYVSEQNLEIDETGAPMDHPQIGEYFADWRDGSYQPQGRGH